MPKQFFLCRSKGVLSVGEMKKTNGIVYDRVVHLFKHKSGLKSNEKDENEKRIGFSIETLG